MRFIFAVYPSPPTGRVRNNRGLKLAPGLQLENCSWAISDTALVSYLFFEYLNLVEKTKQKNSAWPVISRLANFTMIAGILLIYRFN